MVSNSALSAAGSQNGLPGRIDAGHAAIGDQEAHRPFHAVELVDDEAAETRMFSSGVVRIRVTLSLCL